MIETTIFHIDWNIHDLKLKLLRKANSAHHSLFSSVHFSFRCFIKRAKQINHIELKPEISLSFTVPHKCKIVAIQNDRVASRYDHCCYLHHTLISASVRAAKEICIDGYGCTERCNPVIDLSYSYWLFCRLVYLNSRYVAFFFALL